MTPYYQDEWATLLCGDVMEMLATLPDASVQCVVTSPPYWGLLGIAAIAYEDILGDHTIDHPIISGPWKPAPTKQQRLVMIAEMKRRKLINKRIT